MTALLLLWASALFGGLALLWEYQGRAGEGSSLRVWPAESIIPGPAGEPVLLLFAHPHCPCTRASLAELRALMSNYSGRVAAYVVFLHPNGTDADWINTDLWRDVSSLEGVTPLDDQGGREAERFDARTSGQVYLFSGRGELLFNSGITPARGHQGNSVSLESLRTQLEAALANEVSGALVQGPVYGCPILEER